MKRVSNSTENLHGQKPNVGVASSEGLARLQAMKRVSNSTENLHGQRPNVGVASSAGLAMQKSSSGKSLGGSISASSLLSIMSDDSAQPTLPPPSSGKLPTADNFFRLGFSVRPALVGVVPSSEQPVPVALQHGVPMKAAPGSASNLSVLASQGVVTHHYQAMNASQPAGELRHAVAQPHPTLVQPRSTEAIPGPSTWVIEEIIDFGPPSEDSVPVSSKATFPRDCREAIHRACDASVFASCTRRICSEHDVETTSDASCTRRICSEQDVETTSECVTTRCEV